MGFSGSDRSEEEGGGLVGRDREVRLLVGEVAHPPVVALVEGEAGVGKTRLVDELLHHPSIDSRLVLLGRAQPLREPFPLGAIVEALRGTAGHLPDPARLSPVTAALRTAVPELGACLPPPLAPAGDPIGDRHRLFRGIQELLSSLGPAVLVVEDIHWSDEGTRDLIRFLVGRMPEKLALVLTFRPEDIPVSYVSMLQCPPGARMSRVLLKPLARRDVPEFAASFLHVPGVSDNFANDLHERTQGLPFAMVEILRVLEDHRDPIRGRWTWTQGELQRLQLPVTLRDPVLERAGRLSRNGRRVVEAAAVLGVPVTMKTLGPVARLSPAGAARGLREAVDRRFIREDEAGFYSCRHDLARQAIYESLLQPERQRLHLKAARALATVKPLPLSEIAHHLKEGGRSRAWIPYAEKAADRAMSLGDNASGSHLLRQALLAPGVPQTVRVRMAVKLGRAARGNLADSATTSILRAVIADETISMGQRGELRLYLGLQLANNNGTAVVGRAEIARAVSELRRRPALAAVAMSALAVPQSAEGHIDEHLDWAERAVRAVVGVHDHALKTAVLANRAKLLMDIGDPQAWNAVLEVPTHARSVEEERR